MSGVGIVRKLLSTNSALLAVVPAIKIFAGVIPLNTVLPAISVQEISGNSFKTMAMGSSPTLWTERVQITVEVKPTPEGTGYPGVKALLALIRAALPSTRGTVGSFTCDSISTDIEGPDLFYFELDIHSQSQDFVVRYVR